MSTGTYAPWFFEQFFDDDGHPLSGGSIETFIAGTTTHIAVYTDVNLTVAYSNPITLNSAGRLPSNGSMFLTPGTSVKWLIKKSDGTVVETPDNGTAIPASTTGTDITGVAGETLPAGTSAYLSAGDGSKVAGSWYLADSANPYSSTSNWVGVVPASISIGNSGTIRLAGTVTGLISLTVGSKYYVGTAGALTTTAPANSRLLGEADTTSSLVVTANPPLNANIVDNTICDGRLTLTTVTPVTTADVTAATSVFFTPYKGNRLALFDGTNWNIRTFTELTIAVPATTATMYDVFAYDNSGVVAFDTPVAWTNDTTRATALALQNGVLSKTGTLTRRYIGSFRTTGSSGQTEDSFAKRYCWNYYNRVTRVGRVLEATDSWTYTTATYRQANASTANQLDFVIGVAEVMVEATVIAKYSNTGPNLAYTSIGEDSTSAAVTGVQMAPGFQISNTQPMNNYALLRKYPAVGRHFYAWLERSVAAGTTTWYGDNGDNTLEQFGISGTIQG